MGPVLVTIMKLLAPRATHHLLHATRVIHHLSHATRVSHHLLHATRVSHHQLHATRVGKTLVHEFPIFYSHTEWNFLSSGTNTLLW